MAAAIPFVMAAVTIASTAYSAFSSIAAGKEEKKRQDEAAKQARRAAEIEAETKGEEHRRILAAQRARYGASGLTFEGSPLIVQFESMKESEKELARILETGGIKAEAYEQAGKEAAKVGTIKAIQYGLGGMESTFKLGRQYNWW
jgi:hypothetical protein